MLEISRPYLFLFLMVAAFMPLAACGKKPGHVDGPPDVAEQHYPKIYPDVSTDPKPEADAPKPETDNSKSESGN